MYQQEGKSEHLPYFIDQYKRNIDQLFKRGKEQSNQYEEESKSLHKLRCINLILNMSTENLIKHQYLRYRIKIL